MNLKKSIFASVSFLVLALMPTRVLALGCLLDPLECIVVDHVNAIITPLPILDPKTEADAILATAQETLNDIASLVELIKYVEKMQKLSLNPLSLAQAIDQTDVPEIKSVVKGTQTSVDGFKATIPGIKSTVVNFKNSKSTEDAINVAAVYANPTDSAEEIAANERRAAFIQQALIDLHADVLVAKGKLMDLKDADTQSQSASSTGDTVGNSNIVIQMKSFENQVQALEENIASMRMVLEGIKSLRSGDVLREDFGGEKEND